MPVEECNRILLHLEAEPMRDIVEATDELVTGSCFVVDRHKLIGKLCL